MRRAEVLQKKIYESELRRRPETRQKKPCWKLMIRMPAEPSTNVQAVMDDESYFTNIWLLEDFVWISWEEKCQGGWKTKLTQRRIADNSRRKKSLRNKGPEFCPAENAEG